MVVRVGCVAVVQVGCVVVIWVFLSVGVLLGVIRHRIRFRRKRKLTLTPLAGYDTGVRSPWRTPGRFFKPHRGF